MQSQPYHMLAFRSYHPSFHSSPTHRRCTLLARLHLDQRQLPGPTLFVESQPRRWPTSERGEEVVQRTEGHPFEHNLGTVPGHGLFLGAIQRRYGERHAVPPIHGLDGAGREYYGGGFLRGGEREKRGENADRLKGLEVGIEGTTKLHLRHTTQQKYTQRSKDTSAWDPPSVQGKRTDGQRGAEV